MYSRDRKSRTWRTATTSTTLNPYTSTFGRMKRNMEMVPVRRRMARCNVPLSFSSRLPRNLRMSSDCFWKKVKGRIKRFVCRRLGNSKRTAISCGWCRYCSAVQRENVSFSVDTCCVSSGQRLSHSDGTRRRCYISRTASTLVFGVAVIRTMDCHGISRLFATWLPIHKRVQCFMFVDFILSMIILLFNPFPQLNLSALSLTFFDPDKHPFVSQREGTLIPLTDWTKHCKLRAEQ